MISTEFPSRPSDEIPNAFDENYESNRRKSHKEEGLLFVPEDTGPKVFCVVCKNASDWNEIHNYIINENEIDGIPNRKIDCSDECKTCDRMASYVISDEEAEQLKNHPKVFGVNLDPSYYSGTFKGLGERLCTINQRYSSDVKIQRYHVGTNGANFLPSSPGSDLLGRTDAAIYRHEQKDNPWKSIDDTAIIPDGPEHNGDGTGIDLVVCDSAAWYGHIEFIKTGVGEPVSYVGGNVLRSEFSPSATTGVCGVLDMVLDTPYYLDPDFFEEDPTNRLEKRWDGTTVPKVSTAKDWWRIERAKVTWNMKVTDKDNSANYKIVNITANVGSFFTRQQYSYSETSSGGTLSNGEVYVEFSSPELGASATQTFVYDLVSSNLSSSSGEINFYDSSTIYMNHTDNGGTDRGTVLMTTVVPITGTRSAKYVSTDISGGTATIGSIQDFGQIYVNTSQTRERQNGTNTATNTINGDHATPCMSVAYGKTHGWAYNANKWHMSILWGTGSQTASNCFKIHKVFHQNKPDNPILGTKDPTMTSHSWGSISHIATKGGPYGDSTTGYHYYRKDGTGSGDNAGTSYTYTNEPAWLDNFATARQFNAHQAQSYSDVTAAKDMVDAGVILFSSSGNDNQKQVLHGHPDYNNYETHISSSTTLATALTDCNRWYWIDNSNPPSSWSNNTWISNIGRTAMVNRIGFPSQAGMYTDGDGKDVYPSFNIGVLDQDVYNGMEYKAWYSNMGEGIDLWCMGSSVLAAVDPNKRLSTTVYNRHDSHYRIDSNYDIVTSGGTQSYESETELFGGTSCSTPVACGIVATVMQHHRDWTWVDIKNWLKNEIENPPIANYPTVTNGAFWSAAPEATIANSNWFNSWYNVHDDEKRKIVYMERSGGLNISGPLNIKDGKLTIK